MNFTKKLLLVSIIAVSVFLVWFYNRWRKEDFLTPVISGSRINLGSEDRPVFLTARVWGVSGNHEKIVLSESNKATSDKVTDYIFYTSDVYYKLQNGELIIYAPEGSISEPVNKFLRMNVILKGLKSSDEIMDYELNYKKYGLKKISVYNDQGNTDDG